MPDGPSLPVPSIPNPPVRLLSFDGGGIRGLSSLLIVRELMLRVQGEEGLDEPPLPCEYFDMIAGTSTGGIIALMLGRLRMTVADAIKCYKRLSEEVFSETKKAWQDGKFKASILEENLQRIIYEYGKLRDSELRMLDRRPDACKVFVCAMSAANMNALIPIHFRTYKVFQNASPNCKIWEAARATSAAPLFFKRASIQDDDGLSQDYIDGGMGCNNPTARMLAEAKIVFKNRPISTIVSIGTGQAKTIALPKPGVEQNLLPMEMVEFLKAIAANCEATAEAMSQKFEDYEKLYFRFNVDQGMQSIEMEDWEKISEVVAHTRQYLQLYENNRRASQAVSAMRTRRGAIDATTAAR